MQYSPKLKIAMKEIQEILTRHDIAAFICLHTPGFIEYLNHVNPSYSCAFMVEDGMRVRLKTAEVGKEKAKELADGTANMITNFATIIGKHALFYIDAEALIKKYWEITPTDDDSATSHTQQNN